MASRRPKGIIFRAEPFRWHTFEMTMKVKNLSIRVRFWSSARSILIRLSHLVDLSLPLQVERRLGWFGASTGVENHSYFSQDRCGLCGKSPFLSPILTTINWGSLLIESSLWKDFLAEEAQEFCVFCLSVGRFVCAHFDDTCSLSRL